MLKLSVPYLFAMIFFLPCFDALAQQDDPFGSDPFGGNSSEPAPGDTDPFGAPNTPSKKMDSNPFGDAQTPNKPTADPFGSTDDESGQFGNPFGEKAKTADAQAKPAKNDPGKNNRLDPFGAGRPTPAAIRPAAKPKQSESLLPRHRADEKIRSKLSDNTRVAFYETPLIEAAQTLSQSHDIPILVNQRALEELGLSEDATVDVDLSGVSLRSVLKIMLTPLDCTFIIKDEVLQITTMEHAEQNPVLRSYKMDEALAPRAEKIVHALTSTVVADAWEDKGGPCSVSAVDHVLMVSATENVHEEVDRFMVMLEDAFSKRKTGK
jgi:hypothetical protein